MENLTPAPLVLSLHASKPEDVELYFKMEDAQPETQAHSKEIESPPNDMKERFMETLRSSKGSRVREKSSSKDGEKTLGAAVASALKKGGRGRPVQVRYYTT